MIRHKILLAILLNIILINIAFGDSSDINKKEYDYLQSLYDQGNKNPKILLRLSELSDNSSQSLCYAKLGLQYDPNSTELKNRISSIRNLTNLNEINPNESKVKNSSNSFLILQSYYSKDLLALLLTIISFISILIFFSLYYFNMAEGFKSTRIFLFVLSLFLFFQIFMITKTKEDKLKIVSSFEDFKKTDAVILKEKIVVSAPSKESQEIALLKPTNEVELLGGTSGGDWIQVRTNSRLGWLEDDKNLCIININ